jgi:hypothetical protein
MEVKKEFGEEVRGWKKNYKPHWEIKRPMIIQKWERQEGNGVNRKIIKE